LLMAAAWVVLCVVLTIGWAWFQVRKQISVSSGAGSGGIGAVSFGISLPVIGLVLLPAMLFGAWASKHFHGLVDKGWLRARDGRKASFGHFAGKAARQPVPQEVALKDPKDFKLIGKPKLHRKDHVDKTDGTAIFTQDYKLPGMLVAVVAHPQRFGAVPKAVNADKARAVPNVVDVVQFDGDKKARFFGVAVLAKDTWAARNGRDALEIDWDESGAFKLGSVEILAQYKEMASKPGLVARNLGNTIAAFGAEPSKVIDAEYELPYLAHSAMEPMNCLVQLGDDNCEIWNGEQFHTGDQGAIAAALKISTEKVFIHQLYAGGSFGRRANPYVDYPLEAVAIAKAARDKGVKAPVKLVWTREEDTRGGYYRPASYHQVKLALDADGKLVAEPFDPEGEGEA